MEYVVTLGINVILITILFDVIRRESNDLKYLFNEIIKNNLITVDI